MNTKTEIAEMLKEVCRDFPEDYEHINLLKEHILDSLHLMQFVADIEERYKIEINIDDLNPDNFETVESILTMLKKYMR